MDIVNNLFDFIEKYSQENPMKLRLKRFENLNFNLSFAIDQIESRQKIKSKLPLWNQNKKLLFPSVLSAEQASSEITAKYKQCIIGSKYKSICDLTGGLGIDSYYFAASAEKVTYIERYPLYCDVAKYNFDVLQKNNIRVICSDSLKFILECNVKFDAFYIDPARRNSENKRLYDLRDCEPDIIELQSILLKKAPVILLKSSPMIDISRAIQDLKFVKEVHVISVKNECKELFFIINNHFSEDEISINCVNLSPVQQPENYIFTLENEKNLPLLQSVTSIQSYLYEPNSSILKAGAFKSVAISFSISKIHKNIVIKLPMTLEGLKATKILSQKGIKTNVTLIFSATQALLAARAGATYVSPFVGRLDDIGQDGLSLIEEIVDIFNVNAIETEIIVASVRNPIHVAQAARMGADIATVPYKVITQMTKHPLTDKGIENFLKDWEGASLKL